MVLITMLYSIDYCSIDNYSIDADAAFSDAFIQMLALVHNTMILMANATKSISY